MALLDAGRLLRSEAARELLLCARSGDRRPARGRRTDNAAGQPAKHSDRYEQCNTPGFGGYPCTCGRMTGDHFSCRVAPTPSMKRDTSV